MIRVSRLTQEVVITKSVDITHSGFFTNLLENWRREDFTAKDCDNAFFLDLINKVRNFFRRGLFERLWLDCSDDFISVTISKVRVCIVIGQQLAVGRSNRCRCCLHCLIKVHCDSRQLDVVGVNDLRAAWIKGSSCITNDVQVTKHQKWACPHVWVWLAAIHGE